MISPAAVQNTQGAIRAPHDNSACVVDRYIACHSYIVPQAPFFSLCVFWVTTARDQKTSTIPRSWSRPDPQRMTWTAVWNAALLAKVFNVVVGLPEQ